jgi:hypothetical protein
MSNNAPKRATTANAVSVSFDENEIDNTGKVIAGILLVIFLVAPLIFIVGLWPDRMPAAGEGQWYNGRLFQLRLNEKAGGTGAIHINTILFLLVALSGFMGGMIHVASSFVDYVGSGKLKSSWFLWYVIKPFTGAGIGIIFYFVLKAGLLNFNGAESANPYGLVMLALLAGLFTDRATLKLEEIFTALFHPKDERPDKIDATTIKITGFDPIELLLDAENDIVIKGEGLDKQKLFIMINELVVEKPDCKSDSITFKYKVPDDMKTQPELILSIRNEKGVEIYKGAFKVNGTQSAKNTTPPAPGSASNGEKLTDVLTGS